MYREYLTPCLALCRFLISESIIMITPRIPWICSINKWWLTETAGLEPQVPALVVRALTLSLWGRRVFTLHWSLSQGCHSVQLQGAAFILHHMSTAPHPTGTWSCAIWQPHVLRFQVCYVIIAAFASMLSYPNAGPSPSMLLSSLATVTLQATREIPTWTQFFWLMHQFEMIGKYLYLYSEDGSYP